MAKEELENLDYSNLIILKELDTKSYNRVYAYITLKKVKKINTPKGIAINKEELQNAIESSIRGRKLKGYEIDLSTPSKLNRYYKKLTLMNKKNRKLISITKGLKKYIAQDGYAYINLREYLEPQIKMIAKKLECKQFEVIGCIYDLLDKIYLKDKKETENG